MGSILRNGFKITMGAKKKKELKSVLEMENVRNDLMQRSINLFFLHKRHSRQKKKFIKIYAY